MGSRYDQRLLPRERAGMFEAKCDACGHVFTSEGTSVEGQGCELDVKACAECGGEEFEVLGEEGDE